ALHKVSRVLSGAEVELRAVLARTQIALSDLLTLQPGDLITTDRPIDREIVVQIEGRNKFHASLGQIRGKKALQLTKVLDAQPVEAPPAQSA
ncbi:MAG: FliM/FliN family flagellar motor switch protein, partial [Hyphomicrobiales bacterium]